MLTTKSYVIPAALVLATPGVIAWTMLTMFEHTALSAGLGIMLLMPFLGTTAFLLVVVLLAAILHSYRCEWADAARATVGACLLILSFVSAGYEPLNWPALIVAASVGILALVWLGRMAFAPFPEEVSSQPETKGSARIGT